MKVKCKFDEMVPVSKLKPNPDNPNMHPKIQLEGLKTVLKDNCIRHPIIVSNQRKMIVAGHARFQAMKDLGMKKVPVVFQDFDSKQKEYQFMVADNEAQRKSYLNVVKLSDSMKTLNIPTKNHKSMGIFDSMLHIDTPRSDAGKRQNDPEAPNETPDIDNYKDHETDEQKQPNPEPFIKIYFSSKKEHETFLRQCLSVQRQLGTNDIKETLTECLNIFGN